MNDFTLLLQDRFRYVNISKSEKYLLSAKASKISVYDFREKKKLFDLQSPNIRMALFSGNEDFILILKTCSIDIFSVTEQAIVRTLRTGTARTSPIFVVGNALFYAYKTKNCHVSLMRYTLDTQEKDVLYKKTDIVIDSFAERDSRLYAVYSVTCSDRKGVLEINLKTGETRDIGFKRPLPGLRNLDYDSKTSRMIAVIADEKQPNTYNLLSFDLAETDCKTIAQLQSGFSPLSVKARNGTVFVSRMFTTAAFDLTDGSRQELDAFPYAFVYPCDNPEYFTLFNTEYSSLYQYN